MYKLSNNDLKNEIVRNMKEMVTNAVVIDITIFRVGDDTGIHKKYLVVDDYDYHENKHHLVFISMRSGIKLFNLFDNPNIYYELHHIYTIYIIGGKEND